MVTVTYVMPEGDEPYCLWGSYRFFDGHPVEVDTSTEEGRHIAMKAKTNPCFKVDANDEDDDGPVDAGAAADGGDGSNRQPKRRGRKPGSKNLPKPVSGTPE